VRLREQRVDGLAEVERMRTMASGSLAQASAASLNWRSDLHPPMDWWTCHSSAPRRLILTSRTGPDFRARRMSGERDATLAVP